VIRFQRNLTASDACYAVLAQNLGVPLVTADEQLSEAIEQAIFIGNWDIQPYEGE
jgi:predicted nucleic acid-binding protein